MNIIEAFKSRKNIRRSNSGFGFHHPFSRQYPPDDILAEDWEVEPEPETRPLWIKDSKLTKDELLEIVNKAINVGWDRI